MVPIIITLAQRAFTNVNTVYRMTSALLPLLLIFRQNKKESTRHLVAMTQEYPYRRVRIPGTRTVRLKLIRTHEKYILEKSRQEGKEKGKEGTVADGWSISLSFSLCLFLSLHLFSFL